MKKTNITLSIALAAVFSSSVAFAETEVTGKIVHESAAFTNSGEGIGATTVWNQTNDTHDKSIMKIETSARIFIDGDIEDLQEGAAYHVELNLMTDGKALDAYDSNEAYTQRDALREAYIDTEIENFSIRAGKQQVVWGTADGMKLLDAINPTDYSEMAQNQMEDSRIPVWMINAETEAANGGAWQFIISEAKGNKIAGMGNTMARGTTHTAAQSDQGHAFMMKGPDLISGQVNGMMNIAPALGRAGRAFGTYVGASPNLAGSASTINQFADSSVNTTGFAATCSGKRGTGAAAGALTSDAVCLYRNMNNATFDNGSSVGGKNYDQYNILDSDVAANWDTDNPNSMVEYMANTHFGTFDTFVDMTSEYRVEEADGANIGFKFKDTTKDGVNYSVNFLHGKDPNPYVDFQYEMDDGTKLYEVEDSSASSHAIRLCTTADCGGGTVAAGSGDVGKYATGDTEYANAVFTEKHATITNIGGSFDTAIETAELGPVVLRGEALYQKDVMSSVIVRKDTVESAKGMDKGFFDSALTTQKADYFKYVLGVDITALTNMMISAQFIQIRNLDHVSVGNKDADVWKYTADTAVMSLDNNMQGAEENKEFVSLFLSKPFGASGEHRWNNIFMFEENGGKWNRLDAEFSIDDDTQATVEYNKYFGDENTQFGQLARSSNIQVGVKYSF
jgi:hypothetical protein